MLYVLSIILGLLAGIISKGKISNIKDIRINKAWLIILAYLIQMIAQMTAMRGIDFAVKHSIIVEAVVFGMVLAAIWFNRKYVGMMVIGIGCVLNIIVMMFNGGKMPVSAYSVINVADTTAMQIFKVSDGKHILADKSTRLFFLGDIINPPGIIGYANAIVSVGDLVIVIGLAVLIFELMKGKVPKETS